MATRTYKSEPMAAVHEMMEGLHRGGAIDEQTIRYFDSACFSAPERERAARDNSEAVTRHSVRR